ncbi:MAG TPA: sugar-binding domain-containing protein [Gaiellaceae bacterium]|nr:sugar-binding domain-containing protein [Gaiellaceae bacterium]
MSRSAMAEIARLYYVRDLTQQEIAERLGVSRFKVLRLLEQARAEGVVRFEIDETVPVHDDLSHRLEERYGITALVVEREVARAAAGLLPRLLRRDDVLGVAWGQTLASIERALPQVEAPVPVVQICGAIDGLVPGSGPTELAARFAAKTGGRFHPLEAPAVADENALRRSVRPTTAVFDDVSVALLGVGAHPHAAGHLLVHVFDDDGHIVSAERAIALSVAQLRRARVVAAAGGRRKQRAVAGALRTGLVDVLVTDAVCARHALK